MSPDLLRGLVLCRVGEHRLAFVASQIAIVEPWRPDRGESFPHARLAYALRPAAGRLLRAETGEGVVVDSIEVLGEPQRLLPSPLLTSRTLGNSLRGFVVIQDELLPLLEVAEFAKYVLQLSERDA